MKKQKKTLRLDTQTLRNLDGASLGNAAGGTGTDYRTCWVPCVPIPSGRGPCLQ